MKKAPIALLFALAALAILPLPANAIPIHRHVTVPRVVGHDPDGPLIVKREVVRVVNVAPTDSDQDGCPDTKDSYEGPGCNAPAPPSAAQSVSSVAPAAPAPTSVPTASGGCPSYMAGEASSPDAVNPSSGASGCFQVLGSTAAAMGPACADVNATSCVAAICAAQGNAAWAASGSTPCDYIRP